MRRTQKLSPLIPPSDNNHPVTVVPMLAPMMTWIACLKFISPEFTNPTTITVVAEELWIIAVRVLSGIRRIFRSSFLKARCEAYFPLCFPVPPP